MGVCCTSKSSIENLIDSFWKQIKLRNLNPNELKDLIRTTFKGGQNTKNLVVSGDYKALIEKCLVNDDHLDESTQFFIDIFNAYNKEAGPNTTRYFLLSLFFLADSKPGEAKKGFKDIYEIFGLPSSKIKNQFAIDKNICIDIVKVYVSMITLDTVKHYKVLLNHPNLSNIEAYFSLENQTIYVNELFKKISDEKITLETLFKLDLNIDNKIRESIIEISEKK